MICNLFTVNIYNKTNMNDKYYNLVTKLNSIDVHCKIKVKQKILVILKN